MKKTKSKIVFENIGGSFQFRIRSAEDLYKILELDPTAWAALCVPAASLNGDQAFFNALDADGNGMIRVDEVKAAITWLSGVLKDIRVLNAASDTLNIDAIDSSDANGKLLVDFVEKYRGELLTDQPVLELKSIRTKLAVETSGPLAGDGILRSKAVTDPEAMQLYKDVTTLMSCPENLTAAVLEKFVTDAASFVEWAKTAEKPLFRGNDPVQYYDSYKSMAGKIDEYFRFCDLIRIDPAHATRFRLDPAKLPELDLLDPQKIDEVLRNAPLSLPDADGVLDLQKPLNPFYQKSASAFAELFDIKTLTAIEWSKLKTEFSEYSAYLAKAQGDLAGQLGKEKLEKYLAGNEITFLRGLFDRDKALGGIVDALKKLERLLLYCRYMVEFANNFVSFADFFDSNRVSMIQAGRLIMDSHSYNLAVWIDNIAAHKKIAVRSNMCLLYLEVTPSGLNVKPRYLAVAVTGGSLSRIYIGKPAFFVDNKNITYNGKVVDLVDGPISFGQTLFAPFRRISEALGNKLQKLTDFSSTEKQLVQSIDQGKMPAAPAAPAGQSSSFTQKLMGNGSIMLLAGGLSFAALGAGISFIFKSITSTITSISALPGYVILIWIAVFLGIILLPTAIFAFLKLRKRNLTLFLEAGGWAINLPMRLNMHVSGIFTHGTEYPKDSTFRVIKSPRRSRLMLFVIPVIIVLAAAAAALYYLSTRGNICS